VPQVRHTARARRDLLDVWIGIATDNHAVADRVYGRLEARVLIPECFPEAGAARPDIADDARVLVEPPYLILYRVAPAGAQIVRVLHGRGISTPPCLAKALNEPGHPPPSPAVLPARIFTPTPKAVKRVLEFFTAQVNDEHTRKSYLNATKRFAEWCEANELRELVDVEPVHRLTWAGVRTPPMPYRLLKLAEVHA
jgi:toxin ParE1/3/4